MWLGQNSFRVYELLGAAAKIGAMVCPGYWRWAPPEMAFAIDDFSPTGGHLAGGGDRRHGARRAGAEPGGRSALWLRHDSDAAGSYEELLASGDPGDPGLDIDPDSALLVIYTAAISGRQCGSMLSHTNLISMGMSVAWLGDIDNATVFLNTGPMFHIGNFQFFGIPVLLQAGTNVVTPRVVADEVLSILAAEQCTHAYLMPATIGQLVPLMRERGVELPYLKATFAPPLWQGMIAPDNAGTAAMAAGWATATGRPRSPGMPIVGGYGGKGAGNAEQAMPMTRVRILDLDGRECPSGKAGEICLRGDTVHLGYWNRPEINEAALPLAAGGTPPTSGGANRTAR